MKKRIKFKTGLKKNLFEFSKPVRLNEAATPNFARKLMDYFFYHEIAQDLN